MFARNEVKFDEGQKRSFIYFTKNYSNHDSLRNIEENFSPRDRYIRAGYWILNARYV